MENVRKISKKYYLRQIVACWMVCWMVFGTSIALATPSGGAFTVGTGVINDGVVGGDNTVLVNQAASVIEWGGSGWGGIDTSSAESLTFSQLAGLSNSAVLNNIKSGNVTQFNGTLNGVDMRIFIVNDAGIIFGNGATVNATQLVASSLNISNEDFTNGIYQFEGGGIGEVANYGQISAEQVALIGRKVLNAGVIRSPNGYVLMAAGDRVFLGTKGSGVVVEVSSVTVPDVPAVDGIGDVINEGIIEAAGGEIVLAAGDTFSRAIDGLDGMSVAVSGGTGRVGQFGTLNADAVDGDGGSITLTAADVVALGDGSVTTANAGTNGDGGDVVVYSPDTALFRDGAVIEAKGGSIAGDGGFVEVSGREHVEVLGSVVANATDGKAGTFLIDPTDIFIVNSDGGMPNLDDPVPGLFEGNASQNEITDDYIEELLDGGTSVTLNTATDDGGGPYGGTGNILQYSDAKIDKTADGGDVTLAMYADNNIELRGGIESDLGDGALNVTLDAGGRILINYGGNIKLWDGGDISMRADENVQVHGIVNTYAYGTSPVSANIDITGDYVEIRNDVTAYAQGNGSGDATAKVEITATGGDVIVRGDGVSPIGEAAKVQATARDGENNYADVIITANNGKVQVIGDQQAATIMAWTYSKSYQAVLNQSKVQIDAGGNVLVLGDGGSAKINARADDGSTNTADVIITTTGGDVLVIAKNSDAEIVAEADVGYYYNDAVLNKANVEIYGNNVTVKSEGGGDQAEIEAEAQDGAENKANVTIEADGSVTVLGIRDEAEIEAQARNGDKNTAGILITADEDVTVRNENGDEDEVKIQAVAENENLDEDDNLENIENTATVNITAGGIVEVIDVEDNDGSGNGDNGGAYIEAKAKNYIDIESDDGVETLTNLKNTATVNITAADVDVISKDSEDWREAAEIVALAENEIWIGYGDAGTVDLTLQNIKNDADITITATSDEGEGGDVFVHGENGGRAQIKAKARNKIIDDADITVDLTLNGLENTADIIIDAYDDVKVIAVGSGSGPDSVAKIEAEAENEISDQGDTINLTVEGLVANTAGIKIDAGDDVKVKGKDQGKAEVKAKAENDVDIGGDLDLTVAGIVTNTADITIVAGGDVKVIAQSDGAEAEIAAEAENDADSIQLDDDGVIENTADITITTTESGEVLVHSMGYGSVAQIKAKAENAEKNSASVTITTNREDCPECDESDDGYVKVLAVGGGEAYIIAGAMNSDENTADVTINAAGNVEVRAWNNSLTKAKISAIAKNEFPTEAQWDYVWDDLTLDGLDNTASVDITALNVLVESKGYSVATIDAIAVNKLKIDDEGQSALTLGLQNLTNDADVTITTILDTTVEMITNVGHGEEPGTGNVWVIAGHGGEALIRARAKNKVVLEDNREVDLTLKGLENTADVVIDADDDVEVTASGYNCEPSKAKITATAENEIIDPTIWDGPVNLTVEGLVKNDAAVDIDAAAVGAGNVKVTAWNGGVAKIKASAENILEEFYGEMVIADDAVLRNDADVTINADCDVVVRSGQQANAAIQAMATFGTLNTADIAINAGGDVKVIDLFGPDTAKIEALAYNEIDVVTWDIDTVEGLENIANIDIVAKNVKVVGYNYGHAEIKADAHNLIDIDDYDSALDLTMKDLKNTANVTITTTGVDDDEGIEIADLGDLDDLSGDVLVMGIANGEADIDAEAFNLVVHDHCDMSVLLTLLGLIENKADVVIDATGDVAVYALCNGYADIDAEAQNMLTGNYWTGLDIVEEQGPITNTATVDITTGDTVEVVGIGECSFARINAEAWNYNDNEWVWYDEWQQVHPWPRPDVFPAVKDNFATILIDAGGDVIVKGGAEFGQRQFVGGHAEIEALARYGVNNDATVDIDAVGDVEVTDIGGGMGAPTAKIVAIAEDAIMSNTASVYIDNQGDVDVIGEYGGIAYIKAITTNAYGDFDPDNGDEGDNTSLVQICSEGSVEVRAGSEDVPSCIAVIAALASEGANNKADTVVHADEGVDVLSYGGLAGIAAVAGNMMFGPALSNDAYVYVHSPEGGARVIAEQGGLAGILGLTGNGITNDTDVIVCAQDDVEVRAGTEDDGCIAMIAAISLTPYDEVDDVDTTTDATVQVLSTNGGVGVLGINGGIAGVVSLAAGGTNNNAHVGVHAKGTPDGIPSELEPIVPGSVTVVGSDGFAGILALAAGGEDSTNTARTAVAAPGEVVVGGIDGGIAVIGSIAVGDTVDNTATTEIYADDGEVFGDAVVGALTFGTDGLNYDYIMEGMDEPDSEGDNATLIIDSYANRKGVLEDCPECPCCEEPFGPPAPLPVLQLLTIEGCPVETQAAASELGITPETIQVAIANALALNPDIHPCEACARLIDAARILSDEDGSLMAATIQAFNTLAPADAPFTPEMGTSIAMTFEAAAAGTQYASVEGYIDAFVEYVTVLETELGAPVGDSTVFAMEKYGAGIVENANIVAYIEARLAGL